MFCIPFFSPSSENDIMSDPNGLILLHYSPFSCKLRVYAFSSPDLRLQDPKVGKLVVASIKQLFKDLCGIELKPDERINFGVPTLSLEEQSTVTIGQIAEKNYQLFFRCETADGKEFCPIIRELNIYREKYAEMNAKSLLQDEGNWIRLRLADHHSL